MNVGKREGGGGGRANAERHDERHDDDIRDAHVVNDNDFIDDVTRPDPTVIAETARGILPIPIDRARVMIDAAAAIETVVLVAVAVVARSLRLDPKPTLPLPRRDRDRTSFCEVKLQTMK